MGNMHTFESTLCAEEGNGIGSIGSIGSIDICSSNDMTAMESEGVTKNCRSSKGRNGAININLTALPANKFLGICEVGVCVRVASIEVSQTILINPETSDFIGNSHFDDGLNRVRVEV